MRNLAWILALALVASSSLIPTSALADSGGATIRPLPDSSELEASVSIRHDCSGEGCAWFGEASQYPADDGCPFVYDGSHGVWVGPVEEESGSTFASFSFIPEAAEVRICLYVNASEEAGSVGQSHAFDVSSGRELLPTPTGTRVQIVVHVYHGCRAHIYAFTYGPHGQEVGGTWSSSYDFPGSARLRKHRATLTGSGPPEARQGSTR
jgi:hypothetical protein